MGLEASAWRKCEANAAAGVDTEASAQCSGERDLPLGGNGGLNSSCGSAVAGQSKFLRLTFYTALPYEAAELRDHKTETLFTPERERS